MTEVALVWVIVVIYAQFYHLSFFEEIVEEKLLLKFGIQVILYSLRSGND